VGLGGEGKLTPQTTTLIEQKKNINVTI